MTTLYFLTSCERGFHFQDASFKETNYTHDLFISFNSHINNQFYHQRQTINFAVIFDMSIISHFLKKIHIEVVISSRVAEIVVVESGFFSISELRSLFLIKWSLTSRDFSTKLESFLKEINRLNFLTSKSLSFECRKRNECVENFQKSRFSKFQFSKILRS
jgi:hypothetical protein